MTDIVPPVFDASWRKACSVRACSITEVDTFIQAHYLKKNVLLLSCFALWWSAIDCLLGALCTQLRLVKRISGTAERYGSLRGCIC
jgi:hypothetical protein